MKADMKNIKAITVTGKESRLEWLVCAMSAILPNVKNLSWTIIFQHDKPLPEVIKYLSQMAMINDNTIIIVEGHSGLSVGAEKAKYLNNYYEVMHDKTRCEFVLNIDDDMLIDAATLEALSECSIGGIENLYIACQFDVNDSRGFPDYDTRVRTIEKTEFEDFIFEHGEHVVAHHLWDTVSKKYVTVSVRAMSSVWMARLSELVKSGLLNELLLWPKGRRGYDLLIAMRFEKAFFIVPSRGYHLGLETPYYNNDWSKHKDGIKEKWEKEPE